jgi:site-specific recombinase XerD
MPKLNAHLKLKDPKSGEPTLILLKAYYNNQRFVYSTKEFILPQLWDNTTERPTTDKDLIKKAAKEDVLLRENLKEINIQLNRYEDELNKAVQYLVTQELLVTPENLKNLLDNVFRKESKAVKKERGFYHVFDDFLEIGRDKYSERTIKKYRTLLKALKEFEQFAQYPITFENINLQFYDKFNNFLLRRKKPGAKVGLLNDSIGKYFASIKAFMQWSFNRKYHTSQEYKQEEFKVSRTGKNEIVTLTEEEFLKVLNLDLSDNTRLLKVRDLFCFATFVGQRWSDIERFKKEDIKGDWWVFEAYKTKKETRIPFTGWSTPALDILKRYEFSLPIISQQKFNDYLKEVGELAGINSTVKIKRQSGKQEIIIEKPKFEFMSSHMARRTCVTILLGKGVPPTTVMLLTGHTDLGTLMKYENTKEEALKTEFERISLFR